MGILRSLKAGLRRHRLLVGDAAFCPLTGVEVAMESDFGVTCKHQHATLGVGHGLQPSCAVSYGELQWCQSWGGPAETRH